MTNKNPTGRSVHQNQKALAEAVEGFIADVEATIAHKAALTKKGDHAASWVTLEAVVAPLHKLQAALDDFRGEARPVPRKPYERTTVKREVHGKEITEEHESYGMVGISRVSGTGRHQGFRLFGSAVTHQHFFTLTVRRAKRTVAEFGERFYADARVPIVEIALTAAQFAEMITTLNSGDGVPCTITDVEGVDMDAVPDDAGSELRRFHDDFKERLTDVVGQLTAAEKEIDSVLSKPSLNKADKDALRGIVHKAVRILGDSAPFVLEQFSESAEKMIAKSKTEIESFVNLVFQRAGIKAIKDTGGVVDVHALLGGGPEEKKEA